MRRSAVLLALLAAAGCQRTEAPPAKADAEAATAGAPAPPSPSSAPLFFVGRWASDVAQCESAPWVITAEAIHAPGQGVCRFDAAPRAAGPVEVEAVCEAGGRRERRRLRIAYAESARALLIENAPFGPAGLVRCPGSAYPPASPIPPGAPGALPDDRTPVAEAPFPAGSPQAAANVLQTYYALIEARDYSAARRLWSPGADGAGADLAAFSRAFEAYDSYYANIGAPGRPEGAAGSVFVTVPVQVYARRKDGREAHLYGAATLRRAKDVPGASPEARSWRLHEVRLEPAARADKG